MTIQVASLRVDLGDEAAALIDPYIRLVQGGEEIGRCAAQFDGAEVASPKFHVHAASALAHEPVGLQVTGGTGRSDGRQQWVTAGNGRGAARQVWAAGAQRVGKQT